MAYRQALARREDEASRGSPAFSAFGGTPVAFCLPCADQTPESVRQWLQDQAAPGTVVVVRHARWQLYEYHLDEIVRVNRQGRRVHLAAHGGFDWDGDALSAPKHSLTLLEPTAAVLAAAVTGRTWQNGRLAFKRPLTEREVELAGLAVGPGTANRSPAES